MLRQSRQRSARCRVPQQIDLFAENAPTIGGMPAWFGLPMETQAALTASALRDWRWLLLLRQAAFGGLC